MAVLPYDVVTFFCKIASGLCVNAVKILQKAILFLFTLTREEFYAQGKMEIFATKMFSFLWALNIIRIFGKKNCRDEIEHDFCSNIWVG